MVIQFKFIFLLVYLVIAGSSLLIDNYPFFEIQEETTVSINSQKDFLFKIVKEIETTGKISQIETADSYVLVSTKPDSNDQTRVIAYDYEGEVVWKREFKPGKIVRINASDKSDITIIKEPIIRENPYDTSLRDCKNTVLSKTGDTITEFQIPCFNVEPMGKFGFLAVNTVGIHASTSVFDFENHEFLEYDEPISNSTVIDSTRLIAFLEQVELLKPNEKDSVTAANEEEQQSYDVSRSRLRKQSNRIQHKISSIEMVSLAVSENGISTERIPIRSLNDSIDFGSRFSLRQIAYHPESEIIGFSASYLLSEKPNRISENRILFLDKEAEIINVFTEEAVKEFEIADDSTALILLMTECPNKYRLLRFNYQKDELVWEKAVPFGSRGFDYLFTGEHSNKSLIHTLINSDHSCKTDIMELDIETGNFSCPALFEDRETLFHPTLVQNPANADQFVFLNSNKSKLIFATINK